MSMFNFNAINLFLFVCFPISCYLTNLLDIVSSSLPVNIPWSLTEIEGGSLNVNKLVSHTIIEIKPSKKNAYNEVPKMLQSLAANNPELNILIPSNFHHIILRCAQLFGGGKSYPARDDRLAK